MTQSLPPKNIVLYADDDRDDIEMVREAFQQYSQVNVITFPDGQALLKYAEQLLSENILPCLVILDINMPGMNGKETLKALRNMIGYDTVPIVLFTTSTLPSEAAFAKSFNAGFVTKPLRTEQINFIAENFIEHCTDEVKKRINQQKGNK
jgi:CheY-like chemotaxis protein